MWDLLHARRRIRSQDEDADRFANGQFHGPEEKERIPAKLCDLIFRVLPQPIAAEEVNLEELEKAKAAAKVAEAECRRAVPRGA